jgi:hypothetical protein
MIRVDSLFNLQYGNGLDLFSLDKDRTGINFVSRTSKSNGVSAKVKQLPNLEPFPPGLITVSLSGNPLESFLQLSSFYTAFHIMVLSPKTTMPIEQKLFYCHCIKSNKCKYSYGRQANSTLKDLLVPSVEEIPRWVLSFSVKTYARQLLDSVDIGMGKAALQTNISDNIVSLNDFGVNPWD